jgi:hypothetical protein
MITLRLNNRLLAIVSLIVALTAQSLPTFAPIARAGISSCTVTLTPHSVSPGSITSLQMDVTNNDPDNDIQYLLVLRPSADFTILGAINDNWVITAQTDQVTFESGDLPAPNTETFMIQAQAANVEAGAANWSVFVSDSPDGSGSQSCTSDTGTEITNGAPFQISDVTASTIAATSATIIWTTNRVGSSRVNYGKTAAYGSAAEDTAGSTTSHSVTLSGLSPSTTYHYQVKSQADDGAIGQSSDNTFITAVAPPLSAAPITSTGANVPGSTIQATPTETTPPTISLTTDLTKPFVRAPTISGEAADNAAVARVEYSVDAGQNWLPVDKITRVTGISHIRFSFTPLLTEDGNYRTKVRAIDSSGNIATSDVNTLVIDRLPPQTGPLVLSYGPETLTPNDRGTTDLLAGSSYKLTASAVGGPTTIAIVSTPLEQLGATKTFSLTQSAETGLWTGSLSFATPGIYRLTAKSLDGAGNRTNRDILTATVTPAGRVVHAGTVTGISGAKLALYYFEPTTGTWQLWDGAPYDQPNPQYTKSNGSYSLLIPKGRYYLKVMASGHRSFTSNAFNVTASLGVASVIPLGDQPRVNLGPVSFAVPSLNWASQPLPPPANKPIAGAAAPPLIGTQVPAFRLPTTTGGAKRNIDYEGRPTVYSFVTTWSPSSQAQFGPLAAVQANHDVNVVPVFSQEHETMVGVYLSTAGSGLTGLVDPDGTLVPSLQLSAVPQHIFVDRSGRIKKVMLGVLSKDQLLDQLGRL